MSRTFRAHYRVRDGKEPRYGLPVREVQRALVTVPRRRQDADKIRMIALDCVDPDDEVLGTGSKKPNPLHRLV